jgi:hypothetical protein
VDAAGTEIRAKHVIVATGSRWSGDLRGMVARTDAYDVFLNELRVASRKSMDEPAGDLDRLAEFVQATARQQIRDLAARQFGL